MQFYFEILFVIGVVVLVSSCAAVNPNNNVGMTTVDYMASNGDCQEAMEKARPHAENGEPWAQFRMGMLQIDKRCKNYKKPTKEEFADVLKWLTKSGCYVSSSKWERGDALAVFGTSGYYNARASSTNAAIALANLYSQLNMLGASWWWVDHAMKQYDIGDDEYKSLVKQLKEYESHMNSDYLAKIKNNNDDLCAGKR